MDLKISDLKKIVEEHIEKPEIMEKLRNTHNFIRSKLDAFEGSDSEKRNTAMLILKNFVRELEADVMRDFK